MEPGRHETVNHNRNASASPPASDTTHHASVVPPYWQRHERHASYMSAYSTDRPTPISLEDHTDEASEQCRVLWAKGVTIDQYVVVGQGVGAYVVWNCTVETLDVSLRTAMRATCWRCTPRPIDCMDWLLGVDAGGLWSGEMLAWDRISRWMADCELQGGPMKIRKR
jgi:hypothetical protein